MNARVEVNDFVIALTVVLLTILTGAGAPSASTPC